ncbi:MAG: metalloregulator ArsR/SmtB family transcription factor [Acidobacteriota bacterium]|nr:metalloregulator ArsR/SmtB family transcription factor [Acidobacteriota bacterium]
MNENALTYIETFFMALADKTRLRILNLMRDEEVCVCFFTEVIGSSQPKISRHLAYLRNAGIVQARRDGKWMHYSLLKPQGEGRRKVFEEVLNWLDGQEDLRNDREKYKQVCCSPEMLIQIARTPINFLSQDDFDVSKGKYRNLEISAHNELEEFLL